MRIRKILTGFVISTIIIACLVALTDGIVRAQGSASDSDILRKLDDILNTQKAIQDDIAAIKEELAVVKIRVTQNQ